MTRLGKPIDPAALETDRERLRQWLQKIRDFALTSREPSPKLKAVAALATRALQGDETSVLDPARRR